MKVTTFQNKCKSEFIQIQSSNFDEESFLDVESQRFMRFFGTLNFFFLMCCVKFYPNVETLKFFIILLRIAFEKDKRNDSCLKNI